MQKGAYPGPFSVSSECLDLLQGIGLFGADERRPDPQNAAAEAAVAAANTLTLFKLAQQRLQERTTRAEAQAEAAAVAAFIAHYRKDPEGPSGT
jgi:hypothetical protein